MRADIESGAVDPDSLESGEGTFLAPPVFGSNGNFPTDTLFSSPNSWLCAPGVMLLNTDAPAPAPPIQSFPVLSQMGSSSHGIKSETSSGVYPAPDAGHAHSPVMLMPQQTEHNLPVLPPSLPGPLPSLYPIITSSPWYSQSAPSKEPDTPAMVSAVESTSTKMSPSAFDESSGTSPTVSSSVAHVLPSLCRVSPNTLAFPMLPEPAMLPGNGPHAPVDITKLSQPLSTQQIPLHPDYIPSPGSQSLWSPFPFAQTMDTRSTAAPSFQSMQVHSDFDTQSPMQPRFMPMQLHSGPSIEVPLRPTCAVTAEQSPREGNYPLTMNTELPEDQREARANGTTEAGTTPVPQSPAAVYMPTSQLMALHQAVKSQQEVLKEVRKNMLLEARPKLYQSYKNIPDKRNRRSTVRRLSRRFWWCIFMVVLIKGITIAISIALPVSLTGPHL